MNKHTHTNKLINETSPYLLQHAHNPVSWYPWGDEALQRAVEEDKPILVSIGYSACHWCHVMERESFEDEATAQIMNAHFINIKIDREERPDIDHIYMDAVQAITGSGGWPLNVFLTPDLKPFYGGTYYPPRPAFNRSSWQQILNAVALAYKEKKNEIAAQSENLTKHLQSQNILNLTKEATVFDKQTTVAMANSLVQLADKEWGGFGQAPKFPQTFSILYLLRYYWLTGDPEALNTATSSLDKMMMGGLYDHLAGGFCRYSTDRRWQIPHFEKMLYDNALLIDAFVDAYQITKREDYATVIKETIGFIHNELTSVEGGFYSALDADSEGIEGKYYTWSKAEIDGLLGEESDLFCAAFNVSENGNWEHTNILWLPENLESVAEKAAISKEELVNILDSSKRILFNARQKRIRPGLDNKVLLSWNALTITSLCKAYAAMNDELYLQLANKNIQFIEKHLLNAETGFLLHSWNKVPNRQPAFLDDYATLIRAYIYLHEVTQSTDYLLKARLLTDRVIENFSDEDNCFFYFTSTDQKDVLLRKKEIYDGATPSGNSVMAENLFKLSVIFDIPEWKQRAENMMLYIGRFAEKYPVSFGNWCLAILTSVYGLKEIVIISRH